MPLPEKVFQIIEETDSEDDKEEKEEEFEESILGSDSDSE